MLCGLEVNAGAPIGPGSELGVTYPGLSGIVKNKGTRSIQEHPSRAVCGFTFTYSASRGPKPWKRRGIREQPILAVCGDFVGNNTFNLYRGQNPGKSASDSLCVGFS